MPWKTLLTLDQFLAMPENECGHEYELDHGELIPLPPQPFRHELTKNIAADALKPAVAGHGRVLVETGFIADQESWRKPDISIFWNDQLAGQDPDKPLGRTARFCIEVYSPSESQRVQRRRVTHLLETGALVVWILYPETREVQIVTSLGEQWLASGDELTCPELLPDLRIQVISLFQ